LLSHLWASRLPAVRAKISPLQQRRKVPSLSDTRLWLGGLAALSLLIAALIVKDMVFPSRATAAGLRFATVARGTVASTVTGTGTLTPNMQVNVGFKTAGQLTEVDVKVGDHVKTGQLLAKIDASTQQAALAQANAQLAAASANLQQA
jgi:multidrug efflux pump subunit AcrA (membrane-fusion protein)